MTRQRKGPAREYLDEPVQLLARVEATTADKIRDMAAAEGISQAAWIRRALDAAVAEAPRKLKNVK